MGKEHDRENAISELQDMKTIIGACRYCGQTKAIHPLFDLTEEDADERATWECDCEEAKSEREKRDRRDRAVAAVRSKFEPDASPMEAAPAAVVEILINAVDLILAEEAESVTVNISKSIKAKISMTSKGAVKVERTKTIKTAEEA